MTVTSGFSQYLENANLNWFRGTTYPAVPGTLYIALFTTAPVNGSDSSAVEVSGTSYVRKSFTPNSTNFAAPSGAAPATSASGANFVFATPGGSWGTVVGWAIYDAASMGNMLCYGAFSGVAVGSGDTVEFLSGNLTLSVS
jgi:hypothetical protein